MIINFLGSVVALHIGDDPQLTLTYSIFMLGAVIAGTVLFFTNQKKLVFHPGLMETWGKGAFKILFLNLGMILFFLVSAVTFIISSS